VPTPPGPSGGRWHAIAAEVVRSHQWMMCEGLILDTTTAHMLCAVLAASSNENAARLAQLPLYKAVRLAWKCVR